MIKPTPTCSLVVLALSLLVVPQTIVAQQQRQLRGNNANSENNQQALKGLEQQQTDGKSRFLYPEVDHGWTSVVDELEDATILYAATEDPSETSTDSPTNDATPAPPTAEPTLAPTTAAPARDLSNFTAWVAPPTENDLEVVNLSEDVTIDNDFPNNEEDEDDNLGGGSAVEAPPQGFLSEEETVPGKIAPILVEEDVDNTEATNSDNGTVADNNNVEDVLAEGEEFLDAVFHWITDTMAPSFQENGLMCSLTGVCVDTSTDAPTAAPNFDTQTFEDSPFWYKALFWTKGQLLGSPAWYNTGVQVLLCQWMQECYDPPQELAPTLPTDLYDPYWAGLLCNSTGICFNGTATSTDNTFPLMTATTNAPTTAAPTMSRAPTATPTKMPSLRPSARPTARPTEDPTQAPTVAPTISPAPTRELTPAPSNQVALLGPRNKDQRIVCRFLLRC